MIGILNKGKKLIFARGRPWGRGLKALADIYAKKVSFFKGSPNYKLNFSNEKPFLILIYIQ